MDTISLVGLSARQLTSFIARNRQKPYRYLRGEKLALAANLIVQDEIMALSRKYPDGANGILQAGELAGLAVCDDLPWDSRVLKGRWGVLKYFMVDPDAQGKLDILEPLLDTALHWGMTHKIQCLVCKTYTDDIPSIHALERKGFLYMDTNLDYVFDFQKNPVAKIPKPALPPDVTLRLAEKTDAEELIEVAKVAFRGHFSRYMVDECIPQNLSRSVYAEWMRSCLAGYADWVIVAEIGSRIAGYSVWKKVSPADQAQGILLGHYSIAGLHPDFSGRGLFGALTYAGMKILDGQADYIDGPTHINSHRVQRGYHRLGWQIVDARHAFHKWLDGD